MFGCRSKPIKRGTQFGQIGAGRGCQHDATIVPFEKWRTQPVFEQADMLADCAVRDPERVCRSLETAEAGRRFKGPQSVERRKKALHSCEFFYQILVRLLI